MKSPQTRLWITGSGTAAIICWVVALSIGLEFPDWLIFTVSACIGGFMVWCGRSIAYDRRLIRASRRLAEEKRTRLIRNGHP
jgi:hypothetical protein